METADEILSGDVTVGEHGPSVQAPAVHDRVVVVPSNDDQIGVADQGTNRLAIRDFTPCGDLDGLHTKPPVEKVRLER
jgi:hypothetical protein